MHIQSNERSEHQSGVETSEDACVSTGCSANGASHVYIKAITFFVTQQRTWTKSRTVWFECIVRHPKTERSLKAGKFTLLLKPAASHIFICFFRFSLGAFCTLKILFLLVIFNFQSSVFCTRNRELATGLIGFIGTFKAKPLLEKLKILVIKSPGSNINIHSLSEYKLIISAGVNNQSWLNQPCKSICHYSKLLR